MASFLLVSLTGGEVGRHGKPIHNQYVVLFHMKGQLKTIACACDLVFALINNVLSLDFGDVLTTKTYSRTSLIIKYQLVKS